MSCLFENHALAQDTTIYIDLADVVANPGDTVEMPIWIANYTYPIAGYSLLFSLDRPGLLSFDSVAVADSAGTLSTGWEYFIGATISEQSARVTAVADMNVNGFPLPIPPLTLGATLVLLQARVYCDPDTFSGTTVRVVPTGLAEFSDPDGNLILPVSASGATVTIVTPELGDIDGSGKFDIVDVVAMVNCAFRNACPPCEGRLADVNCDGIRDILDVVTLIGHVFRGQPKPACL